MPSAVPNIDRLIEEGLDHYGAGNVDAALRSWEEALAIDPDNEQANSYVDYVRMNYELLADGSLTSGEDDAYALSDEPEYAIEVVPGELEPRTTMQMFVDPTDAGWALGDEGEMPVEGEATVQVKHAATDLDSDTEFDSATREYGRARTDGQEFSMPESPTTEFSRDEGTPGFSGDGTPVGFASETTGLRPRDLGFVQPTGQTPEEPSAAEEALEQTNALPAISNAPTEDVQARAAEAVSPTGARLLPRAQSEPYAEIEVEPVLTSAPTVELGLRTGRSATENEEAPTRESDARAFRAHISERPTTELGTGFSVPEATAEHTPTIDPLEARGTHILDEIDAGAPASESVDDRTRRRIGALIGHALEYSGMDDDERAVIAVELALSEDSDSALAQRLVQRHRDAIIGVFQTYLGDLERQPQLARPLSELGNARINSRAAFLLSRVDGMLTIDELLDVSGMPRVESYRHLCQLFLRGFLR